MSKQSITSFANRWQGKGDEKSDTAAFWNDLLVSLFGVRNTTGRILYEQKVKIGSIDAYIPETRVLIEQKSLGVNLDKQ